MGPTKSLTFCRGPKGCHVMFVLVPTCSVERVESWYLLLGHYGWYMHKNPTTTVDG